MLPKNVANRTRRLFFILSDIGVSLVRLSLDT